MKAHLTSLLGTLAERGSPWSLNCQCSVDKEGRINDLSRPWSLLGAAKVCSSGTKDTKALLPTVEAGVGTKPHAEARGFPFLKYFRKLREETLNRQVSCADLLFISGFPLRSLFGPPGLVLPNICGALYSWQST